MLKDEQIRDENMSTRERRKKNLKTTICNLIHDKRKTKTERFKQENLGNRNYTNEVYTVVNCTDAVKSLIQGRYVWILPCMFVV